jgi:hypothetical protein
MRRYKQGHKNKQILFFKGKYLTWTDRQEGRAEGQTQNVLVGG